MNKRPIVVVCLGMMLLILISHLFSLPVPWAAETDRTLRQAMQDGADCSAYGQIYRVERTEDGCTIYLKNTILVIQSNFYSLENSKITYKDMPGVQVGWSICAEGYGRLPEKARNPGQFDAENYYGLRHISVLVTGEACRVTERSTAWVPELSRRFRDAFGDVLEQGLGEKAGTLQAILLGEKTSLDGDVRQMYQQSGISHVLAISGLHISILGMGLYGLLRKIAGIRVSALAASLFLLLYLWMIGFPVSAQRAVYMFWMAMGARVLGRDYDRPTALALAAIILFLQNPLYLYDSSFLLSFSAAGLLLCAGKEWGAFSTGVWLWLGMLPLTAWFFYEAAPVSIILNLAVIPLLSLVLFFGLAGGAAGLALPVLGRLLLMPAGIVLEIYEVLCRLGSRIPFSVIITGRPAVWQMILFYLGLGLGYGWMVWRGKRPGRGGQEEIQEREMNMRGARAKGQARWKKFSTSMAPLLLVPLALILFLPVSRGNTAVMLDVGQGDCHVITSACGDVFLVDGGSTTVSQAGRYRILPYLKYQGVRRISRMMVTHPDEDHINGLTELLEMRAAGSLPMEIGGILAPAWMEDAPEGQAFIRAAGQAGVEIRYVKKGDILKNRDMELRFCHPDGQEYTGEANAGSLTFLLSCGTYTELFTGDLEGKGEEAVSALPLSCDVLKVAHHGSKNSTSARWLKKLSPRTALISCG
ncbi:MAG TPA: hypothetical protein DF613_12195, partial [Lachnospiraceae bacterium]|nr:hypothetical protein [Lachnospiraceae bacterium]